MPKTRKKPWWSGWRGKSPNKKQRRATRKRCGKKCFLGPNLSFPVCAKGTCRINKKGVMSAYIRAKQWGKHKSFYKNYWGKPRMKRKVYTRVAKKARKLMGWKKGGRRRKSRKKKQHRRTRKRTRRKRGGVKSCCVYKKCPPPGFKIEWLPGADEKEKSRVMKEAALPGGGLFTRKPRERRIAEAKETVIRLRRIKEKNYSQKLQDEIDRLLRYIAAHESAKATDEINKAAAEAGGWEIVKNKEKLFADTVEEKVHSAKFKRDSGKLLGPNASEWWARRRERQEDKNFEKKDNV